MEKYICTTTKSGIDSICAFLNQYGIKTQIHSIRCITFNVYDITYTIEWFINQSTLKIGNNKRSSRIPFKYIYLDNTFPLIDGNRSIAFSFVKNEKKSMFDSEFLYENFRIPIEL